MAVMERVSGALWGLLIADALAMPVHWFYDPRQIDKAFPTGVTEYHAAPEYHPSSIMSLSSTTGGGRIGGVNGKTTVIGDVINHGKASLWGRRGIHYHHGMGKGENTLNALCSRIVTRSIVKEKGYKESKWLDDYVLFMTTPGSHNDTYAESYHRDFFANYARGVDPALCAGAEGHNTATIGGFVSLPPVIFSSLHSKWEGVRGRMLGHLRTTHTSKKLDQYATVYGKLLFDVVVRGESLRPRVVQAGREIGVDVLKLVQNSHSDRNVIHSLGSACYIEGSFPGVLYLAYKYHDDFEAAVVANAESGGENCHRGAALGALMGGANPEGIPQRLKTGLQDTTAIEEEIRSFVAYIGGERQNAEL